MSRRRSSVAKLVDIITPEVGKERLLDTSVDKGRLRFLAMLLDRLRESLCVVIAPRELFYPDRYCDVKGAHI